MKRSIMLFCLLIFTVYLLSGCGGNGGKTATETDTQVPTGSDPATTNNSNNSKEAPPADVMKDAVLGADLSYFDAKFGAREKKDDELTVSYMNGKIRVTENQGYAYNIFNAYVDRGEAPSAEEALAFIKQFLPKDADLIKDEEDATTKIHTYTYTSQALKAQTQLAGQLTIVIYKDPGDDSKVRQAQISIDITANM